MLDNFLKAVAGQQQRKREGRTLVITGDQRQVIGFASTCITTVLRGSYPRAVYHLTRLAVDASQQHKHVGRRLLAQVCREALHIADEYGLAGIVVDAKKCSNAHEYYSRFGFAPLGAEGDDADSIRMFISVKQLRSSMDAANRAP